MQEFSLSKKEKSNKDLTMVIYGLYAAAFFCGGITLIAGIIMNYVKKENVVGSFLESHFRWQIRTFWFSLLWFAIGALTAVLLVGVLIIIVACLWMIYRIVKGAIYLNDNKPMYT